MPKPRFKTAAIYCKSKSNPLRIMVNPFSTWCFMLRECIYGECAHEQHVKRTLTLTLTRTITAYSVSGNVVRVCILICATKEKPCRKRVYQE